MIIFFVTTLASALAHFPMELKQRRQFDKRSYICFMKAKKTSLTVKLGLCHVHVST